MKDKRGAIAPLDAISATTSNRLLCMAQQAREPLCCWTALPHMSIWFSSQMPLCSVMILVRPTCGGWLSAVEGTAARRMRTTLGQLAEGWQAQNTPLWSFNMTGRPALPTRMMSMMSGTQVESAGDVMR